MEFTNGIAVRPEQSSAKAIAVIRNHTKRSIAEIRGQIASGGQVYVCDGVDSNGLAELLILYRELVAIGVDPIVYDDDRVVDIRLIKNELASHRADVEGTEDQAYF